MPLEGCISPPIQGEYCWADVCWPGVQAYGGSDLFVFAVNRGQWLTAFMLWTVALWNMYVFVGEIRPLIIRQEVEEEKALNNSSQTELQLTSLIGTKNVEQKEQEQEEEEEQEKTTSNNNQSESKSKKDKVPFYPFPWMRLNSAFYAFGTSRFQYLCFMTLQII